MMATTVAAASAVNVKDHEARGDGVTNDRLAIIRAYEAAKLRSRILYFPAGIYYIDMEDTPGGVIYFDEDTQVLGDGIGFTRLKFGPPCFTRTAGGTAFYLREFRHLTIRDLTM